MDKAPKFKKIQGKITQLFAVVGLIAVLAFGVWISVQTVRAVPSMEEFITTDALPNINAALVSLSGIFTPSEKISVFLEPQEVVSGTTVILSWKHNGKRGEGVYTFSYQCSEGVALYTPEKELVECGKNLDIKEKKIIAIVPQITPESADIPMTIAFKKNLGITITGSATLAVTNSGAPKIPTPVTEKAPRIPALSPLQKKQETFNAYSESTVATGTKSENTYTVRIEPGGTPDIGKPDLAAHILHTGILDSATNTFTAQSSVKGGERAAVQFHVINVGGKPSGVWRFNAVLPTFPFHIFSSDEEPSLSPGDRIEFTLGFDQIDTEQATGTVIINVDPANSIAESNEDNNLAKAEILIIKK